jgi:diguanylate cyclase (GGDEF)-like protein
LIDEPGKDPGAGIEEKEKDLFVKIFRQLGAYRDPYESISGILKDTCEFFGFYSGFVYEADHTQVFRLCEHYLGQGAQLAGSFSLEEYLGPRDIGELLGEEGEIVYLNSRKNRMGSRFLELFSAQTLVMVPVIFEGRAPIAFVGLMDRRRPIRLSKREIDDADAVLSVLAGHIKTRVYQRRLEYAHRSMKNIVENAGMGIYVGDYYTNEILFANESTAAPYGGVEALLGRKCWEVFSRDGKGVCPDCPQDRLIDDGGKPARVYTRDYQRPLDGVWFRVLHTAFPWVDGRLAHVVSSINISENKRNEELIRRMAEEDTLTGLPNRRKFMADLEAGLETARRDRTGGCLLFMDLDDFKGINDTLGHLEGDALLSGIGKFLLENRETLGAPYRYGGDEFVIISPAKSGEELRRIRDILLEHFSGSRPGTPGASCGISIGAVRFSGNDGGAEDLIRRADAAMYRVKRSGKHGFLLSGEEE